MRTNNKFSPFPEEINRSIAGLLADFHFAPTNEAKENLLNEKISEDSIIVTGNTVIDALIYSSSIIDDYKNNEIEDLEKIVDKRKIILVTGHRRENFGDGFKNICHSLIKIAQNNDVQIIYPVHLNPNVKNIVNDMLSDIPNIHLINPLNYPAFIWLMNKSYLILTDSGGVQEEAPSLGIPVLVMRDTTERPEGVENGTAILVGTNEEKIIKTTNRLLQNEKYYKSFSQNENPYGDGNASKMIANFLIKNVK